MSRQVNMHEAKTHFSKLAEAVEAGEEVIIARAGKPVMQLVKMDEHQKPIVPGFAAKELAGFQSVSRSEIDANFNNLFQD